MHQPASKPTKISEQYSKSLFHSIFLGISILDDSNPLFTKGSVITDLIINPAMGGSPIAIAQLLGIGISLRL